MPDFITTVLQGVLTSNSKSTVLRPLGWLIALLGFFTLGLFRVNAPAWLGATFAFATLVSAACYLISYAYFAKTDKNALRTERFAIQEMAIRRGFIGDNVTGYMRIDEQPKVVQLPSANESSAESEGEEK